MSAADDRRELAQVETRLAAIESYLALIAACVFYVIFAVSLVAMIAFVLGWPDRNPRAPGRGLF